jgi:hypothetical protein
MHHKIPAVDPDLPISPLRHLMRHDVTNQTASANAVVRRRMVAAQTAASAASHSRHHVSRRTQS